jgi:hypothetical protein
VALLDRAGGGKKTHGEVTGVGVSTGLLTSASLNELWGRFNVFSNRASANSILVNVLLAAYHLGCLFEVSVFLLNDTCF